MTKSNKVKAEEDGQQTTYTLDMPNKDLVFQSQTNTIEPFTGKSTQNAQQWISHATNVLQIQGFNDTHELTNLLSGFLDGEALNWFQDNKATLTEWKELYTALTQRFPSPPSFTNTFEYFQQLSNRRQGLDEPTADYYAHVLKLCNKYTPLMSDAERVDHLKKGLRPSLLEKVLDRDPVNPAQFIAVVLKAESNQRILQVQVETGPTSNNNNITTFTSDRPQQVSNFHNQRSYEEPQQPRQQRWSDHQQQQQQHKQNGSYGGRTCYTCGKKGHILPACHLNWA
ncbi:unnamed protein product [Adineta steineri]|uniref:CCHC-type domain-containing protein n=1 Tax=Adineta steineri TaxID=433720 RepID=A0A813VAU2_9BILA|nr:unnamed protein product [Adineta steineri]CAF3951665.1 unnamed protein product [Adineta steineri]